MILKRNLAGLFITSVIMASSLTGCGNDSPVVTQAGYQTGVYTASTPQIIQPSQQCCACTCQQQAGTPTTAPATTTPAKTETVTKPSTTATPKPTSSVKPTTPTTTATPKPTTSTATDPASKGRAILDKVLAKISNANAFQATVDKYEKSLSDGSVVQQSFNVFGRKPGQVKVEVTYHTKSSSIGAKMSYIIGSGKATVRPGGALSFITKEFDQTDDNITSPNKYTPEQIDFFTMVKRLSNKDYKAELSGKTTVGGAEIYLLKITKSGTNEFDTRIKHEIIGFDAKTFDVKLWETYADSAEAYMRITVKTFSALDSLPDSTFKV